MNSALTIVFTGVVLWIPCWLTCLIVRYQHKLGTGQIKDKYGFLYESYDMTLKEARVYFVWDFYKRLFLTLSLLLFDNLAVFQLQLLISF